MKKSLLLLLVLACFVSVSFPAVTGDINRIIFGGTTGNRIHVRDYEILASGKWDKRRELSFTAKGTVGTIGVTAPDSNEKFFLPYTFDDTGKIKGSNVSLDYETFTVLGEKGLSTEFGGFALSGLITQVQSSNRFRFGFIDPGFNVVTQKTRSGTGNPFGKKMQIFDNDPNFLPVTTSFDWGGRHAAQGLFQTSTGDFFADFLTLNGAGKPSGNPVRFRFENDVSNIKLGAYYRHQDGFNSYAASIRSHKLQGSTHKTRLELDLFNADTNIPVKSRIVYNFKSLPSLNAQASFFNPDVIYDAVNETDPELSRSWLIHVLPKGGKLNVLSQQFDPFTLDKIQNQTLIGSNDPILMETGRFYAVYGIGFYYHDEDY